MPTRRSVLLGFLVSFFLHGALVFFLWDIRGSIEAPHEALAEARPPLVQVRLVEASAAPPPASRRPEANRIRQEQEKGKRNKKAQVTNRTHFEDLPPVETAPSAALPPVAPVQKEAPPVPQELSPSSAPVDPVAPASEPVLTTAASGEEDPAATVAPVSQAEIEPEPGESVPAATPPAAVMSEAEASTAPAFKNKGSLLRSLDRILQEEKRAATKAQSDDADSTGEAPVTDATPQTDALASRQEPATNQTDSERVNPEAPLSRVETLRLKRQIGQCWNPPIGVLDARELKIRIDLDLREDATIERYQLIYVDGAPDPDVQLAFEESAKRAFHLPDCQKLDLPPGRFDDWRQLGLFFSVAELLGYAPS